MSLRILSRSLLRPWPIATSLVVVVATLCAVWCGRNTLSFNPVVWKRDNFQAYAQKKFQLSDASRDRMVANFVNHHELAGMAKIELVNLLGEPDFTNKEPFKEWDMIYWLGPDEPGLAGTLDTKYLVFKLDSAGKIGEFKVTVG